MTLCYLLQDRPVPTPRSRLSNSSDTGKDLAKKTRKEQVNADQNIDEKHDATIETSSARSTQDAEKAIDAHEKQDATIETNSARSTQDAEKARDAHETHDGSLEVGALRITQDNLNKSETEHEVSTTKEITVSGSEIQHAVSSNGTMNVNCDAVNKTSSYNEITDKETVQKVLDDVGNKEGSHESSGNACDEKTINNKQS